MSGGTPLPTDESPDFHPEPRTQSEYLAALWSRVQLIDQKVTTTNGRVNKLEKFMWGMAGGLLVVSAVIVPLFVRLVLPNVR